MSDMVLILFPHRPPTQPTEKSTFPLWLRIVLFIVFWIVAVRVFNWVLVCRKIQCGLIRARSRRKGGIPRMEEIVFWLIVLLFLAGAGYWIYRDFQVVECVNCHIKLTRSKHRRNRGCIRCGSDLTRRVK